MKIAIIQFAPLLNQLDATIERLDLLLTQCNKADLVVLPELANSGYNFSSKEEAIANAESINDSRFIELLKQKCQENGYHIVSGFNEKDGKHLYNSSVLVNKDEVVGCYRKLHLFMNEQNIFQPGNAGLPVFEVGDAKIGMLICFDWTFPEVWRLMAMKGVDLILHPSNLVLPYAQSVVKGYAITNKIFVATANRIGTEESLTFTGQSQVVSPQMEVLSQASPDMEEIIFANIDLSLSRNKNITPLNHSFESRRTDVYKLTENTTSNG
ncbi:carbon-nitrogen hydrolase [Prolixibacteraceae bacterium JC049]|nr:carbon-nitrogen hydrolase [Prolixibacteraceae bacterium JC049]